MKTLLSSSVTTIFILFAMAGYACGQSTAACHCFRDRSFDPARKFAADEYILATSFNSLLSAWSGVPKKNLVMARMGGTGSGDLSAALWVAGQTGQSYENILNVKEEEGSWARALSLFDKDPKAAWRRYVLEGNKSDPDITGRAEEALLAAYFDVKKERIRRLRDKGLNTRETALALALSARTGKSMDSIADARLKQQKSWGEMVNDLGLKPEETGAFLESLLPVKAKKE